MGEQSKKGVPRIAEPPNDGREWICRDTALEMLNCGANTLWRYRRRFEWECYTPPDYSQKWYLKKEVAFYADFLKDRDKWRKRHRPAHYRMQYMMTDEESALRVFVTLEQAAAMLKVTPSRVGQLARQGKLPVFPSRKPGLGSHYWFSPTSIRNYLADEERTKWRASYAKGQETRRLMKHGIDRRVVHAPRPYVIPRGWLRAWEVAERLGISETTVHKLRKKGGLCVERFPLKRGRWTPWCFLEASIEEYKKDEAYLERRRKREERKAYEEARSAPVANRPPRKSLLERAEEIERRICSQMEW